MVRKPRAAVCLTLVAYFSFSGGYSLLALAAATSVISLIFAISAREKSGSDKSMLVVLRSCSVISHEVHEYGCDADVAYKSCRVHGLSSKGSVRSTVNMGGDAKRVALFLQGENTTSEWFSKVDKSVIRGLSKDELSGAISIMVRDGMLDITLGMEPDGEDSLTLYSVSVESGASKLETKKMTGDHLSDKKASANR